MQLFCCRLPLAFDDELLGRIRKISDSYRLCKAEKAPVSRQLSSLATGLLLQYGLKQFGRQIQDVRYESGRPVSVDGSFYLSLSHSGEYLACILSHRPVGVDVQRVVGVHERLKARICTDFELKQLQKSKNPSKDLIALWALKESYYKAAGNGQGSLTWMRSASFLVDSEEISGPDGWTFALKELPGGYFLSCCEKEK